MTFNLRKATKTIGKKYKKNAYLHKQKETLYTEIATLMETKKNLKNSHNRKYNPSTFQNNPYKTQQQNTINPSQFQQLPNININTPNSSEDDTKTIDKEKNKDNHQPEKQHQMQNSLQQPFINIQYAGGQFDGSKKKKKTDNALEEKITNIDIKDLDVETERVLKEEDNELIRTNIKYPVTPAAPKEGEKIFAWANVFWNKTDSCITYKIIEPHIDSTDSKNISKIKQIIEDEINVDFKSFSKDSAKNYINEQIKKIINRFGLIVSKEKLSIYEYYITRDFIGFNKLQPVLDDENIEDISCDGIGIPVFVYHRDPKFGSIQTNITFDTENTLDDFVRTLAQRTGRSISMASPLLDGALPDGSRLQATLATDIAKKGSNFTIRRFSKTPLTPIHLLKYKSMDARMLAYLWLAIEHSSSLFIVGATASGKTSILNALSLFIKPTDKVVSIEDTPEIRLPHEHWIQEISREGFGEKDQSGNKLGEVSMFDLLKGSLRQRPDYIIVGEIRGAEAAVLFQQMATGHPGISTFHADSLQKVINRLLTRPINLPPSLLESLDILVFIKRLRYGDKYIRRTSEIVEIKGYDTNDEELKSNTLFRWDAGNDSHNIINDSYMLGKISKVTGISVNSIKHEIQNRMKVLDWMNNMYITNYIRVGEVIKAYYNDPERVLDLIGYD
ncbi:MAG: type II/IV secretion system ATPase subunit [Candidatus Aenigmarchaeota archaeon]|nr:type II/IV secretion system ATPase subunit [Candidatus Aenigmarchaeota archaeon]